MPVIDINVLKALGSRTRLRILGRLRSGHMTLSDLSGHFGMHPSSVKEHLDLLVGAGLIRMEDDGRKWKYYRLTSAGAGILDAGELKVSVPALAGLAFVLVSASGWQHLPVRAEAVQKAAGAPAAQGMLAAQAVAETAAVPAQAAMPQFQVLFAAAGILLLIFAFLNWRKGAKSLRKN